jgi:hypothetical protein
MTREMTARTMSNSIREKPAEDGFIFAAWLRVIAVKSLLSLSLMLMNIWPLRCPLTG